MKRLFIKGLSGGRGRREVWVNEAGRCCDKGCPQLGKSDAQCSWRCMLFGDLLTPVDDRRPSGELRTCERCNAQCAELLSVDVDPHHDKKPPIAEMYEAKRWEELAKRAVEALERVTSRVHELEDALRVQASGNRTRFEDEVWFKCPACGEEIGLGSLLQHCRSQRSELSASNKKNEKK